VFSRVLLIKQVPCARILGALFSTFQTGTNTRCCPHPLSPFREEALLQTAFSMPQSARSSR
jgi:hypothetical protein